MSDYKKGKDIFNKYIISFSNPYEEDKLKKISENIRNRILQQQSEGSTTISYNRSGIRLNMSGVKRNENSLPLIASYRKNKYKTERREAITSSNISKFFFLIFRK
jgi:hypothetical protein